MKLTPTLSCLLVVVAGTVGATLASSSANAVANANAEFVVLGATSDKGVMRAVLCTPEERFPSGCKLKVSAPAHTQGSSVVFAGVPAGRYAFAVLHDEDNSGRLGVSTVSGRPKGFGFSNDATGPGGLPPFDRAAVDVQGSTKLVVHLRFVGR